MRLMISLSGWTARNTSPSSKALKDGKIVMEDKSTPKKPPKSGRTGDSANGFLWMTILVLAGGALAGTVWSRRRREF